MKRKTQVVTYYVCVEDVEGHSEALIMQYQRNYEG